MEEIEINDYPREAQWKVTQKETTSRLQDEFQTAVTECILKNCVLEIRILLNEETLRVGARALGGGRRYNVL